MGQSLQEQIKEIDSQSVKADEALLKFFNDLNEEVKSLPEVKYYDTEVSNIVEDIDSLKVNVEDIRNIVSLIKKDQKELKELKENHLLNEPPDERESVGSGVDPLTPMDQKFATLDDLSNHYRIFISRIQTQLSTMGGGGAGFIKDLDDVSFDQTTGNNKLLIYNSEISKWVGIGSDEFNAVGAAGTWGVDSVGIHTTKVVGINTTSAKSNVALFVSGNIEATGNVTVGGTITYEDVKNVDSIGIVTARSGIGVLAGGIIAVGVVTATSFSGDGSGLTGVASTNNIITGTAATFTGGVNISGASNINVTGVSTINTGIGTVHIGVGNTTLLVQGDARVTGILTIGTGSITLDPNERKITGIDEIIIGTATTVRIHQDTSGEIVFSDREGKQASVGIGTTVSINTTGIITAATLKASTAFYPPIYTTTQRDAGTFSEGAMIFNTTSKKMEFYNGTSWQSHYL